MIKLENNTTIVSGFVRCTLCPKNSVSLAVGRVYQIDVDDHIGNLESEMVTLNPADPELEPIVVARHLLRWPFFDSVS